MANNYVIISVLQSGNALHVKGTVNGVSVSVPVSLAAVQALPNQAAQQSYIATIMLAAVTPSTTDVSGSYVGSFSQ